jgi:cytochrome b
MIMTDAPKTPEDWAQEWTNMWIASPSPGVMVEVIAEAMARARYEGAVSEREACALLVEDIWSEIESQVRSGWASEDDVAATFEGLPGSIRARTEGEDSND